MLIELSAEERDWLLQLVDAAIAELGPEIHHTRTYKDELKQQRRTLRNLRAHLAPGPPPAGLLSSETAPADLVGTP